MTRPPEDTRDSPPPRSSIGSRLSLLIGERRKLVVALVITSILSGFAEAATLAAIALLAAVITGASHPHTHLSLIHLDASAGTLIAIAFVFATVRLLLQFPLSILPARIAADVQAGLRTRLFHSFTRASWDLQSRDREGQLQETMTSQVMQATNGVMNMTALITSSFTLSVLVISAFALNVVAAAIVLVVAVGMFGLLRPLRGIGVRRARALSQAQVHYAAGIAESIRVAEETQVFGAGAAQRSQIDGFVETARRHFFSTQMLLKLVANLYQCLMYLLFVAGLWALYLVGKGHAGSLGAVVLILIRASTNGQSVQSAYQGLAQAMPFIERTQEAERRYRESIPVAGALPLPRVATLAFEDVSYSYRPGRPVLSDISFEVDGGEVVGVIGPSGAGKSTLVQILLRLRSPDDGRYLINGTPAQEFSQEDWHARVAYVPQEPRLLHASVADNIRYFRDIDDEAVQRAARLARIHEDIVGWADGYETVVGPRADAVSGGQQQRICLARALAARPEVLVLDEPTSALDPHSETLIGESLTGLKHELTLFIVAHRMSTLDICDRVMIIIDGKLAAFDTVDLLQQHNHYYRSASKLAVGAPGVAALSASDRPSRRRQAHAAVGERTEGGTIIASGSGSVSALAPGGRVPDFFIAGHPKSGTTALYEMLRRHPQIFMSEEKEPWYFSPELRHRPPPRKPFAIPETFELYMSLFAAAGPGQLAGEASTTYLWSRAAAGMIAEAQPDARIIAILREPASFLRSLHLQFVEAHIETEGDLRRALALEQDRQAGRHIARHSYWPQLLQYSEHVRYVEQLRRYHEVFAPEQVLVLIYDDFRADNEGTVRTVLRFLGVDDTAPVRAFEANPTVRPRSRAAHELVHTLSVGRGPVSRGVKSAVTALTPLQARRRALGAMRRNLLYSAPDVVDEELTGELRRRFAGEVVALGEYLDRDLVGLWGYGDGER